MIGVAATASTASCHQLRIRDVQTRPKPQLLAAVNFNLGFACALKDDGLQLNHPSALSTRKRYYNRRLSLSVAGALLLPFKVCAMRQRITFIHPPGEGIDPDLLKITADGISGPDLSAVREDRITLFSQELPMEVAKVLRDEALEVHVRWGSPLASETLDPLGSRLSPGFHVFITPKGDAPGAEYVISLCPPPPK